MLEEVIAAQKTIKVLKDFVVYVCMCVFAASFKAFPHAIMACVYVGLMCSLFFIRNFYINATAKTWHVLIAIWVMEAMHGTLPLGQFHT